MKVRITQEDIDDGIARMAACCPIALALKRRGLLPIICDTEWRYAIGVKDDGRVDYRQIPLNVEARAFVRDFDHYGASVVKPCTLEL